MTEEKLVKCDFCGKEVEEWTLSRDGECGTCKAADRSSDMCVGDLGNK